MRSTGTLVSLWGTDRRAEAGGTLVVSAAFALPEGLAWIDLPLPDTAAGYPDLSGLYPAAARMQRATADLLGIAPGGATGNAAQRYRPSVRSSPTI